MLTVHEGILSYMKLSENESQVGYPMLKEAAEIGWYKVFKKTKESVVRKWVEVVAGICKHPCSLENLLGVYVVDSCGDLARLDEDNIKNIIPKPKTKCACNSLDNTECMCPSIQDGIVQTVVLIEDVAYTNKTITRLQKNGNIVSQSFNWVPSYRSNGIFKEAVLMESETTICSVDILPSGCPAVSEENAMKLFACGCMVDCDVPYMRDRYPALYNQFGYYKNDRDHKQVHIFNTHGHRSKITQVLLVFQSNGEDMLIPDYARAAFTALLDWGRKMYSPSFTYNDRIEAKRNYRREELDMLKYLNPIPYEWFVQGGTGDIYKAPYYRGIHSDFQLQVPAYVPPAPAPQYVTNIIGGSGSGGGGGSMPITGIVGNGQPNDPVSGLITYQSDDLIGVGLNNRLKIEVDDVIMSSYGQNKSFNYDTTTGVIDFNTGYIWQPGSSLWINTNQ